MHYLIDGPKKSKYTFIFAHGAGAPMDSDWMNDLTELISKRKVKVIRFEFPYMEERRKTGKKRPPNAKKVLLETFQNVVEEHGSKNLFIGGKSMGGRMASLLADEMNAKGLVLLGFPFHAPGKEPGEKMAHLSNLKTPTLLIQGTRDPMGKKEEVTSYKLSKKIKIKFLEDGDHSFKPRKKSGFTLEEHLETAADHIVSFIEKLSAK